MLTGTAQLFYKEAIVWKSLQHPNVMPLLGVSVGGTQFKFGMVSKWMGNGNINEFVEAHRDVNRFKLVRFRVQPAALVHHSRLSP
jgi:hypothetical protein